MKKNLIILLLFVVSILSITSAETYTTELQSAYNYAQTIGITTQPSIDSANMYGSLLRSHMAKMMVNYVENVLGREPDTSLSCTFTDIDNQNSELKAYIIQACQLGLMGVGISAFNPTTIVTRAQFGTVLSRALYSDANNDGDPYYANHLSALKDAGIMTNISTPSDAEVRGYVMLMMMRASETVDNSQVTPSICENSETQLLCLVESSSCPSECQISTTTAGTLTIGSTTINPGTLPSGTKYIGSIKLTATTSDITINSLSLQKIGTFAKGWIEDDGVKIGVIQSFLTDTSTTTTFSSSTIVKQGETKILSIFIEGSDGDDQGIVFSNNQTIGSTASSVSGSFPIRLVK